MNNVYNRYLDKNQIIFLKSDLKSYGMVSLPFQFRWVSTPSDYFLFWFQFILSFLFLFLYGGSD